MASTHPSHTAATPAVHPRNSDTLYVSPRIRFTRYKINILVSKDRLTPLPRAQSSAAAGLIDGALLGAEVSLGLGCIVASYHLRIHFALA